MTSEATQLPVEASATDDQAETPSVGMGNDISSSEPERRQSMSVAADEVTEKAGNADVDNNPMVDDNAVQSADVVVSPSRDPAPSPPIPPPPPSSVDEQLATTEETKTNAESQQPLTLNSIPPVAATSAIADESVKEETPATQQESSVDGTTSQLVASDEVVPSIITTTSSPPLEPKEEKLDDDEVKEVVPDKSKEAMEITNPTPPVPQDEPKESSSSTKDTVTTTTTTPPGRRVFQCSSCNTYYEDWNLFLHMRNVHNRFICLLCLGLFPNAKRLAKHLLNRHGLSDNHFQDTKDMLAWNDHRPCHMMCVSCESVEECGGVDGNEGQTHSCGAVCAKKGPPVTGDSKVGQSQQQQQVQKKISRRQARIMNKVPQQERSNKEGGGVVSNNNMNNNVSSDLVPTASTSSGFKLKIKGLSNNNNNIKEGAGDGGVVVQAVMESSNENPQEDGQEVDPVPGDDNNNMDMDIDKDLGPNPVEVSQEEPGDDQKKEPESGAFSFNFILSKKGLVRNPNPSRRKLDTSMSSDQEEATGTRHSGTAEEEGKEQEQSLAGSSGSDQVKKEAGEEAVVPPLLVSKLKLKIPKYIVPVESSDEEEEDDEEDESESDEEESGNNGDTEDEEKSSSQFRPVKEEVMDEGASKEVPRSPGGSDVPAKDSSRSGGGVVVKEEVDGVAVDRNNTENGQGTSSSNGRAGGGEIKTEAAVDPKSEDSERKGSISLSVAMEIDDTDAPFTLSGIKSDDDVSSKDPAKDPTATTDASPPEEDDIPLIDADGLHLAHPTSQSFELSLDQPLDHIPAKEFLRICLRSTIPFCLYCYHARRIAVNAKMLAVHMIATHRFTALVDSITAEELMNNTIVARLKSSLEEMANLYFNLDDYDSDIVAPLKMKAKIFECFQCRFTTGTHKELYLHNRKLHLKTVLLCLMCRSTFYNYSELLCHICPGVASRDLNYDLQFRCYYCNVNDLPSAFRLMVHLRKAHAVCEVCLEECFDQTRLSNHAWKHKLHHFCYRCGIAYRNKQDITRHLFWKHGTESELCKKCLQKRWPHIYHFCLPPMQFNCDQCVLTFGKAVHLRVHKRLHQEESPHVCGEENCGEKFISKRMLEKHGRVHLGLPPEGQGEVDGGGGEGNANGMDVEKEEIIGGGGSSKGGASDNEEGGGGPDPIMAMPVPNLSESDSSDDEEENSRASSGGGGQRMSGSGGSRPGGGNLLEGMQMTRLSDSDSEDTDEGENGQKKTRPGSVNTALLEGNTLSNNNSRDSLMSSGKTNPEKIGGDVEVNSEIQSKEAGEKNNISPIENSDQKGDILTSSTENVNNKLITDSTSAISRQITSKSLDPVDSSDEDGERSKTKAIIDIWENFRSYQATQIQQQRQSDDEEEDLIAPLPPPILHVLQSDHDYGLMYKVYSRIDDDQDLKEIQDIEMMRRSGKLFKSSANCDSDSSACSCGTKCSCKSSKNNSSSSSSSSNSSSSSSSSSSEEDESKMTKKQKLIRAQRKAKRRARKLKKTLEANGGVLNAAETDNLLLSINDEVVTRLPETDLETDESDTDEEFYDANPYKIAQERIAEKNKQEEEAEEEKRSRREKRRRHRQARREAKLKELEEKTGAALESRLEAVAAAVNSENSRNVSMVTAINTPTTTPNVVPKLRLTFSAKFKKEQQERVNGGTTPGLQRSRTNSPVVNDQMMRFSHTPPPAVMNNYHHHSNQMIPGGGIGFVNKYNHNNNINSAGFGTPISTQHSLNNDEDSSSSSSNVKRSKRRRIPNKFYGYEGSDDESSAAQLAMLTGQVPTTTTPGGGPVPMMFRPTPPPNLTWNKEDLPSGAGGFTGTQSGVHNSSSGSRMSVDSKLEGVVMMRREEFPPAAKKQRRQSQQAERIINHSRPVFNNQNMISNMSHGNNNMINKGGPPAALLSNVDEELDEEWNAEEEDDEDEDDDLELDDGLRTKNKRKRLHNNNMMTQMNSDNNTTNRDLMITSGRTSKINLSSNSSGQQQQMQRTQQYQSQQPNSFHGVFAAQATKAAEEAFKGRQQQSRHPQLVGQLQPAVRNIVRPEPAVPRLKIRSTNNNGVVMKQQQMSSASHSSRPAFSNTGTQNIKKQQQHQIQQVQQTNETASSDLYCYCRRPYVGEMIGCDGEGCHIEWFHFECVGILMAPQGKWYCPDCSQRRRPMTNGRQSTSSSSAFSMIDRV